MELQIDTDQREQSQVNIGSMENVINNYFIDNRGTMLFLIEEHEELLKEKIKTYEHVFIEPTSEDLFQYISAEKSAPLIILKEFYPSSNSKYENAKIINIIKQLYTMDRRLFVLATKMMRIIVIRTFQFSVVKIHNYNIK